MGYSEKLLDVDGNTIIWRYMDFSKFMHIIETKTLFFTRADKFEDKYEGCIPPSNINEHTEFIKYVATLDKALSETIQPFAAPDMIGISCWHMNPYESDAMWRLYSKSNEAIAIVTTVKKFADSFEQKKNNLFIYPINYIDYKTQGITQNNMFSPFLYKRKSFEHEKELRALVFNFNSLEQGIELPVNIDKLIDKIYISPFAQKWFYELVKDILERYKIDKEIIFSELNEEPKCKKL